MSVLVKMSVGLEVECRPSRCHELAQRLREMYIPAPKEDVPELPFTEAEEANFWFFLAAICHQTSPVGQPALEGFVEDEFRQGWDYLVHAFRVAATRDRTYLTPGYWAEMGEDDLVLIFSDKLSDPPSRLELIHDLGTTLIQFGWVSVVEAGPHCRLFVRDHTPNLLNLLSSFKGYSDPVEKKSVFFLALMHNCGIWSYADQDRLPAPVDYHEVRGHLRIGTIYLTGNLRDKVLNGLEVTADEDIAIRMTVREAIQTIANEIGRSPNALHYLFWNLFRTYCTRGTPQCDGRNFSKLPSEYGKSVLSNNNNKPCCPFLSFCDSANAAHAVDEHRIDTEYY